LGEISSFGKCFTKICPNLYICTWTVRSKFWQNFVNF
jgi:hypothetical protein